MCPDNAWNARYNEHIAVVEPPRNWAILIFSVRNIITHHLAPGHPPASSPFLPPSPVLLSSPPTVPLPYFFLHRRGLARVWFVGSLSFPGIPSCAAPRLTIPLARPPKRTGNSLIGHTNPPFVCTATPVVCGILF